MPSASFYRSPFWRALRAKRLAIDNHQCTVPGCDSPARIVEHTITRPHVDGPCSVDRIELLRSLCADHDNQIKERVAGQPERKRDGRTFLRGHDATGMPLDPDHPWNRRG